MNIYEDYKAYMKDTSFLFDGIKSKGDISIDFFVDDIILILDYLSTKALDGAKLSSEEDEIFDIGYGYISNILEDLKHYYEDYFDKDIILFNSYKTLYPFSVMLEDLKGYLIGEDNYQGTNEENISDIENYIDDILINKKKINKDLIEDLNDKIDILMSSIPKYTPSYIIFCSIRQEMNL